MKNTRNATSNGMYTLNEEDDPFGYYEDQYNVQELASKQDSQYS